MEGRAGPSHKMWRKPRWHHAKQVVGQNQRPVRLNRAEHFFNPSSKSYTKEQHTAAAQAIWVYLQELQQRSQQRQGTAGSVWAGPPGADGLMHHKSKTQRKHHYLIPFPLVPSDTTNSESSCFKFLKRAQYWSKRSSHLHCSFTGMCTSPRSGSSQEVQKMSICAQRQSKTAAYLLLTLLRKQHGDFCKCIFFSFLH